MVAMVTKSLQCVLPFDPCSLSLSLSLSLSPMQVGRLDNEYPKVNGHKSAVLDVAWNPFNDNEIASASEDCMIKLWTIPDGGLLKMMVADDARLTLEGHQKKVW